MLFPILSRNRFAICLRGIARGADKITLMLSYPSDEVGNHLIDPDIMDEKGVNPWSDVLTESRYRELFGYVKHTFTGVDYVEYYTSLIREEGAEVEVLFANAPEAFWSAISIPETGANGACGQPVLRRFSAWTTS